MAAAKKAPKASKKKVSRLVLDEAMPAPAQAASIAITLCRAAKVDTFDDIEAAVQAGDQKVIGALASIKLDDHQVSLIEDNAFAVRAIGAQPPMRSVVVCEECLSVLVVSGGSSPKRCTLTRGCTGTAHRATTVARVELT